MLISDGVPTIEDIIKITPSDERFAQGPVAIVECFQEIPCNPCVKACKRGAIAMPNDINDIPVIDPELCNGCSLCVSLCPGLAIFIVDKTYSKEMALVKLPYEYVPVPEASQYVTVLNRAGEVLGDYEVVKVMSGGKVNMTYTISLTVPQELVMEVRDIKVKE
ncbi:MAG: 4Fe-4S binding protein [Oscillospiraceae bacterium]|nr:4Fe-4S binding protein [Oscillospiraceae bacterium]